MPADSPLSATLACLAALLKEATPGPWSAGAEGDNEDWYKITNAEWIVAEGLMESADAALIVAAVNVLPLLLSELERLEVVRASGALEGSETAILLHAAEIADTDKARAWHEHAAALRSLAAAGEET